MKEEFHDPQRFIFFYQFQKKLPRSFIHLSAHLAQYSIKLVPVDLDQLRDLSKNKSNIVVLAIESDLPSRTSMAKALKSSLGIMLRYRRISLFHISSFEKNNTLASFEKSNHYKHLRLPESYESISQYMAVFLGQNLKAVNKWPGGKRAKLPAA